MVYSLLHVAKIQLLPLSKSPVKNILSQLRIDVFDQLRLKCLQARA